MGYQTVFKEVLREYDRDRTRAAAILKRRREEAYNKLPALRELDEAQQSIGLQMTRAMLTGGEEGRMLMAGIRERSRALAAQKETLLAESGFPPDYFTGVYRCMRCKDTGYLPAEESPGASGTAAGTVPIDMVPTGAATEKCPCLRQRLINKYYDLSNLSDILKNENFDTFDLRYYSETPDPSTGLSPRENIQVIYRLCSDFVSRFDTSFDNLLFYGDTGLGKTFLCNCVAKDMLDRSRTVLYLTAPKMFQVFEDHRFNRDEMDEPDETVAAVTSVDLLIIDDLGTEFSTVVTNAALFSIINSRLLEKKHTVISTNLAPSDFETQYSERIVSRFIGHYKMLKFIGEDIRRLKKYGNKR